MAILTITTFVLVEAQVLSSVSQSVSWHIFLLITIQTVLDYSLLQYICYYKSSHASGNGFDSAKLIIYIIEYT